MSAWTSDLNLKTYITTNSQSYTSMWPSHCCQISLRFWSIKNLPQNFIYLNAFKFRIAIKSNYKFKANILFSTFSVGWLIDHSVKALWKKTHLVVYLHVRRCDIFKILSLSSMKWDISLLIQAFFYVLCKKNFFKHL